MFHPGICTGTYHELSKETKVRGGGGLRVQLFTSKRRFHEILAVAQQVVQLKGCGFNSILGRLYVRWQTL